jgi:hypothetical protein
VASGIGRHSRRFGLKEPSQLASRFRSIEEEGVPTNAANAPYGSHRGEGPSFPRAVRARIVYAMNAERDASARAARHDPPENGKRA